MLRYATRLLTLTVAMQAALLADETPLEPIRYNNPGLVVDLGVGLWAWPLPMDYDRDGDLDLVVSCPDKPSNGTWFFENPVRDQRPQTGDPEAARAAPQPPLPDPRPTFKPAVRIADGPTNVQVSEIDGQPVVMTPGKVYANFRDAQYSNPIVLPLPEKFDPQYKRYRANQWKLLDWEHDGDLDVIVGLEIWDDYGWDNAWDEHGNWTNGPLHGFVYLVENVTEPSTHSEQPTRSEQPAAEAPRDAGGVVASPAGTVAVPLTDRLAPLAAAAFAAPRKLTTSDGHAIDVYGMPSPNFADFDRDGDLDLICGEFLDRLTYFENTGTRSTPEFESRGWLKDSSGFDVRMNLQMIVPVALDWDGDGHVDLVCGDEDGRVAFIQNIANGVNPPQFYQPAYFRQQAHHVKFGALATPFGVDWDRDGLEDVVCGNTAGYVGFIRNLGDGRWAAPEFLRQLTDHSADGVVIIGHDPIRRQAGPKGSIQGPCEAKWGYTTLSVADWHHDGDLNVVMNTITGQVEVRRWESYPRPVEVAWEGPPAKPEWVWWTPEPGTLTTQWRTTPCVVDWNEDGLNDLVMLDHEGYLAFYQRTRGPNYAAPQETDEPQPPAVAPDLPLLPPQRIFKITGPCEFDQKHQPVGEARDGLLRLNARPAGASGRRKLCIVDWDGDGRLDLLVNSVNVNWLRNVRTDDEGFTWFEDMGQLDSRVLAGHDTSPTTVDWDNNGIPDLLVGAEDGRLYFKQNPRTEATEIERARLVEKRRSRERQSAESGAAQP